MLDWNTASPEDGKSYEPKDVFEAWMKHFQIANTAYPINHNETLKPYKVPDEKLQDHISQVWQDVDDLLLYAHVPFCSKICSFCELSVVKPRHMQDDITPYFDALSQEIDMYGRLFWWNTPVSWFDIGGGTPSIVDTKYIAWVIEQIDRNFQRNSDMRVSIETTPKIAAEEVKKMQDYFNMGIRRISMWVQSLNGKLIWRADASTQDNFKAAENIRKAWFWQFNIDVMYGFAWQEDAEVEATMTHILEINPEFVTVYPVRYKWTVVEAKALQVQQEKYARQYKLIIDMMQDAGYDIRPGKNTCSKLPGNDGLSDYLHHRVLHGLPYLGFWLWAQSFNPQNNLSYNHGAHVKHNAEYIRQVNAWLFPIQDAHHLSREAAMGKMIAISFFYGWVHLESFEKTFGQTLEAAFPEEIQFILEHELMEILEDGILQLTQKWMMYYSWVISLFYSPATKKYLLGIQGNDWMWKSHSVRDIK